MDTSNAPQAASGQKLGLSQTLGIIPEIIVHRGEDAALDYDRVQLHFPPMRMTCYAWSWTLSEMFIDMTTIDEFRFKALIHFVVETPVHAATDHPEWLDDVVLIYELYTQSNAHITSVTCMFRRGCGKYLYEVPASVYASEVAWPVRNVAYAKLGGNYRLRVTAC